MLGGISKSILCKCRRHSYLLIETHLLLANPKNQSHAKDHQDIRRALSLCLLHQCQYIHRTGVSSFSANALPRRNPLLSPLQARLLEVENTIEFTIGLHATYVQYLFRALSCLAAELEEYLGKGGNITMTPHLSTLDHFIHRHCLFHAFDPIINITYYARQYQFLISYQ